MANEDELLKERFAKQQSAKKIAGQLAVDFTNDFLKSTGHTDVLTKDRKELFKLTGFSHPILQQFFQTDSPEEFNNLVSFYFPSPEQFSKTLAKSSLNVLGILGEVFERFEASSFALPIELGKQIKEKEIDPLKLLGAPFKPLLDQGDVEIGSKPGQYPSGGEVAIAIGLKDKDDNFNEMLNSIINRPDVPEALDQILPFQAKAFISGAEFAIRNPVTSAKLASPILAFNLASAQFKMLGGAKKFSGFLTEPLANGVEQAVKTMHKALPDNAKSLISEFHMNFVRMFADQFNYAPNTIRQLGDKTLQQIDSVIQSSAKMVVGMGKVDRTQSEIITKLLDGNIQVVKGVELVARVPKNRTGAELLEMATLGTAKITEKGIKVIEPILTTIEELGRLGIDVNRVQALRNRLDALSSMLIKQFPEKPFLVESIKKNMGRYIRRIYRSMEEQRSASIAQWKQRTDKLRFNVFGIKGKEFKLRASDIKNKFSDKLGRLMGKYANDKARMELSLTDLDGIGLVTEARLKSRGFGTISKLARARPEEVMEAAANLRHQDARKVIQGAKRVQEMQKFIDQKLAMLHRLNLNPPKMDWSDEAMEAMGRVTEFEPLFMDSVYLMTHDAFMAKMFREIATNKMFRPLVWSDKEAKLTNQMVRAFKETELTRKETGLSNIFRANEISRREVSTIKNFQKVSEKAPEGFKELTSSNHRWGALEGTWVHPSVHKFLTQQKIIEVGKISEMMKGITTLFKLNTVIMNPKSHFNQFFGNAWLASFILNDYSFALGIKNFINAAKNYGSGGTEVSLFRSLGGEKGVFAKSELMKELSNKLKVLKGEDIAEGIGGVFKSYANSKTVQKASELFSASDILWRYSIFKHHLDSGLKAEKAMQLADRVIPRLDEIGTAVEFSSKFGIAPFVRWQSKITPILVETLARTPGKMIPTFLFQMGWNESARQIHGLRRDEANKIVRRSNFGNPAGLLMPFKDNNGDFVVVGLQNIISGFELLTNNLDRYAVGLIGNPALDAFLMWKSYLIAGKTLDPFTGRDIDTSEKLFESAVLKRLSGYIFPAPVKEGIRQTLTGRGFLGGEDFRGRSVDRTIEGLRSLFTIGQDDPEFSEKIERSKEGKLRSKIKFSSKESEKRQFRKKLEKLNKGGRVIV